ncbi:hypothetical protein JCM17136A_36780 [Phocaeicola sartorii JCM 17136 = DSM 21941]
MLECEVYDGVGVSVQLPRTRDKQILLFRDIGRYGAGYGGGTGDLP